MPFIRPGRGITGITGSANIVNASDTLSASGDGGGSSFHWTGTTRTAASNAVADVSTTLGLSSDGDIIIIPNGSVTWASGISTTKKVLFRAATIAPVAGGRTTQSLVITNNSSTPLFDLTSGNTTHVGIAGIRFNEGTGTANHVRWNGTGTKVPIMYDVSMECKDRFGTSIDVANFSALCQGGYVWAFQMVGNTTAGPSAASSCLLIKQPRAWNTASTMGSLDTDGNINFYMEDSFGKNTGTFPDLDDNGRVVIRHCLLDGVFGTTHGPSSSFGGRHAEYDTVTFQVTEQTRNHTGRYFWLRAGTANFKNCLVKNADFPGEYGNVHLLDVGEQDEAYGAAGGTGYPALRAADTFTIQCGWGHNGTSSVLDPIYISGNQAGSSAFAYTYGFWGGWEAVVVGGREIFPSTSGGSDPGTKPGYTTYTYPHPLRAGCPTS